MPFDWRDYFSLAKNLHNNLPVNLEEAARRSIVSRGYYSIFCLARNQLISDKSLPKKRAKGENIHELVASIYKSRGDKTSRHISSTLEKLRLWRNSCDYDSVLIFDTDNPDLEAMARSTIKRAERFITVHFPPNTK